MEKCEHKFIHLRTGKQMLHDVNNDLYKKPFLYNWRRVDYFYCEKCLEEKEIEKESLKDKIQPIWFSND